MNTLALLIKRHFRIWKSWSKCNIKKSKRQGTDAKLPKMQLSFSINYFRKKFIKFEIGKKVIIYKILIKFQMLHKQGNKGNNDKPWLKFCHSRAADPWYHRSQEYQQCHPLSGSGALIHQTELQFPHILSTALGYHSTRNTILLEKWKIMLENQAEYIIDYEITFTLISTLVLPIERPSPTATISPPCGFDCADVGSKIPPTLFSSAVFIFTKTLSPRGLTEVYCTNDNKRIRKKINKKTSRTARQPLNVLQWQSLALKIH